MAKSHSVDETEKCRRSRAAPSVSADQRRRREAKERRRRNGKRAGRVPFGSRSRVKPATSKQTKQQICLDLLSRQEGATIEELQAATGWQQHSVRGFLAGAVKKKLGLTLLSEKPDEGPRRYRIANAV